MGFFKGARRHENASLSRNRVIDSLCRSSYPVKQQDLADSAPRPVRFAEAHDPLCGSSSEDEGCASSIIETAELLPQVESAGTEAHVLIFDAIGNLTTEPEPIAGIYDVPQLDSDTSIDATPIDHVYDAPPKAKFKADGTTVEGCGERLLQLTSATSKPSRAESNAGLDLDSRDDKRVNRSQGNLISTVPAQRPTPRLRKRVTKSQVVRLSKRYSSDSSSAVLSQPFADVTTKDKPSCSPTGPAMLSVLEIRVKTLQDQYESLDLQYRALTSHQVESLEIVKDVQFDLCTTQITTTQHSIEIADLQDSRRLLATELAALKVTVSACQEQLQDLSCTTPTSNDTHSAAVNDRRWKMEAGTLVDLSQKTKPKYMSIHQYKANRQAESLSSASSLISPLQSSSHSLDVLAESGTAAPLQVEAKVVPPPVVQIDKEPSTAPRQPPLSHRQTPITGTKGPVVKSKVRMSSHEKFKILAKEKLASVSYFHRFRTKAQ